MRNKITISLYVLALVVLIGACTGKQRSTYETGAYILVWSDEFDYNGLPDSTKWEYDTLGNSAGWGNGEAQYYTAYDSSTAHVENGILSITAAAKQIGGKDFCSARLISKADWQFGKIEVRAKVPAGRGTWAALWMMPGGWLFPDGNWPDVGEIDILEHVGYDPGRVHSSAHSRDFQWQKGTQKTATYYNPDLVNRFHTYTLEWDSTLIQTAVDDSVFFSYRNQGYGPEKWPYNKPFYLILNLAVGGAWGAVQGIDTSAFPQTMELDYVRVYQKKNAHAE